MIPSWYVASNCEKISEVQGAQGGPVTPVAFLLPPHSGNEFRLRFRIDHIQLGGEEFP